MTIAYPKNLEEYRALRFDYNNDRLSADDRVTAESFIIHWRVVTGAYALSVLTKMSGKKQRVISKELGIKERQFSGMINGVNTINKVKSKLASYFNVNEDILSDYSRQTGQKSTT
jgi:hypothetical protein